MRQSPDGHITLDPNIRGGRPTIRGTRIAVADVLGWLSSGMSNGEILDDFPELTEADIRAALSYAADRERHTITAAQ
ncbi:DUF433 domain-containing protein [Aurantimonas sp. E1-2-R+4]|uniref:DUF433 domain-containing protein n=1 Tax=Aurantimonas sp. E1-2-R+4 TaxID=3113714 RepID=UPI002F944781